MKVRITNMKAPWPKGSGIGAVVSFEGDTAPGWAVGKFARVGDDVTADFSYEPAAQAGRDEGDEPRVGDPLTQAHLDAMAHARRAVDAMRDQLQALDGERSDLASKLKAAEDAKDQLKLETAGAKRDLDALKVDSAKTIDGLREQLKAAEGALATAQKPGATAKKG